jgi:protein TonB
MADVLIVCVREDEPQAKALADMFEAAGFSIGGAPSSDGALRSSGAGVVVWSQASIRSRPFLDAAQRVINADKAVVASLIDPPPPSSIGESPAFDLSRWDGDPNDPALDPLFFAVDRMVNAARAGVGAAQRETRDYAPPPAPRQTAIRAEPPPRRPEPPQYRAPPPEPQQSYRVPPQSDPLGSEAEHWRAIRDSRNPADFMDYLARYGPDGAFSEVAELRLNQLTASGAPPQASQRPAVRPPPPAPRAEPPPQMRRTVEPPPQPQRRPDALPPTQRRVEPPPQSRRPPPIDRDYTRDLRDPPKGQGGPLRAFVLIALLGGAALIGGLYFGGGMGNAPAPATEQAAETQPATSTDTTSGDGFSGIEEAPSVPLSQAVTQRADRQPPAREQPQRAEREQPQRTVEREQPRREATPTSSNAAAANTGPVPLSPNSQGNVVPIAPPQTAPVQTANVEPSILGSATPPQQRAAAGTVVWAQRPTARRISDLYPRNALNDGVGGRVVLDCRVQGDLSVNCSIASETPSNAGFGRAALSASNSYRARATLSDGTSAVGSSTRIAVNFQAPQR